jgi:hypothetical protein
MNDKSAKIKINRRQFIMAGVAFLAAWQLPSATTTNRAWAGKTYSLGDGYYAMNGWVVKKGDLA